MTDKVYNKLAKVLNTLPNGFPSTESGVEIKLLRKIFTPWEAELFCDLRLTFETAEEIAGRTGRPFKGLDEMLSAMFEKGQIFMREKHGARLFRMAPWVIGIYEFQVDRMDREFCELNEEYAMFLGAHFAEFPPQIMQVIPIERKLPVRQEPEPYEFISNLIENGQTFVLNDCICKKEQGLLGKPCSKPIDVCLLIGPKNSGMSARFNSGRSISKGEAYQVMQRAEEAGLVHMTSNVQNGHWFICNCCGCCCAPLQGVKLGIPDVVNVKYNAVIDPGKCASCGTCRDERCQVAAIEEGADAYRVIAERCIGCGLCVSTCPNGAISLIRKEPDEITNPPVNEKAWRDERARRRGVDYSHYK